MSIEKIEKQVIQWAQDRSIFAESTPLTRFNKVEEEIEELEYEVLDGNIENIKLEAGDVIVTLINLLHPYGLDIETCLAAAYEKIKGRTGMMIDGTFVKDSDLPGHHGPALG